VRLKPGSKFCDLKIVTKVSKLIFIASLVSESKLSCAELNYFDSESPIYFIA